MRPVWRYKTDRSPALLLEGLFGCKSADRDRAEQIYKLGKLTFKASGIKVSFSKICVFVNRGGGNDFSG